MIYKIPKSEWSYQSLSKIIRIDQAMISFLYNDSSRSNYYYQKSRSEMSPVLLVSLLIVCSLTFQTDATISEEMIENLQYGNEIMDTAPQRSKLHELVNWSTVERRQCTRSYCCPVPLVCCSGYCCYNYKRLMQMILCTWSLET